MRFDLSFAAEVLPELLRGLWVTVEATVVGFALALLLGLAWAVARRSRRLLLARPAGWAVEFLRSTPLLVQLYFLFYLLPQAGISLSPLVTGVLALGLHYSAYAAEIYRAGIEGVPRGQWEAALALDLTRGQTFRRVILPQALPPIVPALGNRLVALFKETPLLATVTVLEMLGRAKLIGAETFRYLEPLTLVGLIFLLLSLASARLVRRLEVWSARPG